MAILQDDSYLLYIDEPDNGVKKEYIALNHDATKSYIGGEFVWYNGALYQARHECSGNFSTVDWKKITVSDGITNFFKFKTDSNHLFMIMDSNDKLMFGIQKDGTPEFAKSIVELDEKVDKEQGKSLINRNFAQCVQFDSTNALFSITDSEGKALFTINYDGKIDQLSELDDKVNKEIGKGLISNQFSNGVRYYYDDKNIFVIADKDGRALLNINRDGVIEQLKDICDEKVNVEIGKSLISNVFAKSIDYKNSNILLSITDNNGRQILTVNKDGVIEQIEDAIADKVDKEQGKSLIDNQFAKSVNFRYDKNHLFILSDHNGRDLISILNNGEIEITSVPDVVNYELNKKVDKENGKSLINKNVAKLLDVDINKRFIQKVEDKDGRFIYGVHGDGTVEFGSEVSFDRGIAWSSENLTELQKALAANGIDLAAKNQCDWSDASKLHIQIPKCAIANFSGITSWPTYKGDERKGYLEFWDLNGNYFKKKVLMDVQGNSTQWYPKKNVAIDLCNDDWIGDDTFSIKFGDWVEQDSYHFKAWWVDMFRGCGQVFYELLDDVWEYKRGPLNKPWKKAKVDISLLSNRGYGCSYNYQPEALDVRMDSGARCHPMGFPIICYLNGNFYGIYSMAIKKHRANYHMDKKNYSEILIDGVLSQRDFWSGSDNINWTTFELKNPKTMITMDGKKYNGDNPKELIDKTSPNWTNSKDQKNTLITKTALKNFSNVMPQIEAAVQEFGVNSQEVIDLYNEYFDVDNLIDYILFSDVILDSDTGTNNVLWTTWDGHKWYACPYDIDRILGIWGGYLTGNAATLLLERQGLPTYYIGKNSTFKARLAARYAELRTGGIFTVDHLYNYVQRWTTQIGIENYKLEYEKWPNNIVNNNAVVNEAYWEIQLNSDGSPIMSTTGTWSSSTAYAIGDEAFYGPGNVSGYGTASGYYKFKCIAAHTNQRPFSELRCKDSLWRLYSWLTIQIRTMDNYYGYTG